MATYSHVKKGANGGAVEELQRLLNQNGYSLSVDGSFGSATQAAVRDYQAKNNLTVDGIVGNQTWSSLFGNRANTDSSPQNSNTADWLADYEKNKPSYSQSQALNNAADILAQFEGNKPGAYQSAYVDQIDALLNRILNREQFSYDFASDPMYQQYADRYQQQGELAMMDAMGQAAALTGGYGSSYGQQVGQQTYQGYMQALNDVIPELRDAAYQMYQDEGNKMLTDMSLLQGLDQSDYGRYRDDVSDYYADLNYYYNKYNDMSDREYNMYLNDLSAWERDRDYYYNKQQDEQAQANWQAEYDLAAGKAAGSSGGSGGSGGGGSGYKNGSLSDAQIRQLQSKLGVTADGKWGSKSSAAAGGLSAEAAWKKYMTGGNSSKSNNNSEPSTTNKTGYSRENPNNIDWVYVTGYGRLGASEFQKYLSNGKIRARKNSDGSITYVKV